MTSAGHGYYNSYSVDRGPNGTVALFSTGPAPVLAFSLLPVIGAGAGVPALACRGRQAGRRTVTVTATRPVASRRPDQSTPDRTPARVTWSAAAHWKDRACKWVLRLTSSFLASLPLRFKIEMPVRLVIMLQLASDVTSHGSGRAVPPGALIGRMVTVTGPRHGACAGRRRDLGSGPATESLARDCPGTSHDRQLRVIIKVRMMSTLSRVTLVCGRS